MSTQKKKNLVNFIEKLKSKKGDEYELVGEYTTMKTPTQFKHNKEGCNQIWDTTPDTLLRTKKGCPYCAGNKKGTQETFEREVFDLVGNEYSVVGEYVNARDSISMRHNHCGHKYPVTPYSFKAGNRCPECYGNTPVTLEEFTKAIPQSISVTGNYINLHTEVECTCLICKKKWTPYPANLYYKKSGCPNCAGNARITKGEFLERLEKLHPNEYSLCSEVISTSKKVTLVHSICREPWEVTPSNIFAGKECPVCKRESKGERRVKGHLKSLGLYFETQKKFPKCKHKKELPFDFWIPSINTLIEYDGEQHSKPVNFGGRSSHDSVKEFEIVKLRDSIKTTYAKDNNINLLRIPYLVKLDEIPSVIDKFIQEVTR